MAILGIIFILISGASFLFYRSHGCSLGKSAFISGIISGLLLICDSFAGSVTPFFIAGSVVFFICLGLMIKDLILFGKIDLSAQQKEKIGNSNMKIAKVVGISFLIFAIIFVAYLANTSEHSNGCIICGDKTYRDKSYCEDHYKDKIVEDMINADKDD